MPTAHVREARGHPRHERAHRVPVPRQAGDEGGAARGRRAVRRSRPRVGVAAEVARVRRAASAIPLILKPRDGAGASGAARVDSDARARAPRCVARLGSTGRIGRGRGVHRGPRGLLRHAHAATAGSSTIRRRTTTRTCSRRCARAGSRRSSSRPTGSTARRLRRGQGDGPEGHRAARHRDLGDAHGVVLRPQGAASSPRSAAARRACARGTSTTSATTWTSIASGRWRSSHGRPSQTPSRRFSAGIIALRPDRDGRITRLRRPRRDPRGASASSIIDWHLPPPGTPTQGVEAGYMANAWMRMKHDELRHAARACSTSSGGR